MASPEEAERSRALRPGKGGVVLTVLSGALTVLYPVAVYFGLAHFRPRVVGLLLIALLLPGLLLRARGVAREALWGVLKLPLALIALLAVAAALDDPRLVLALPVLINTLLLAGFGGSLRSVPMVERFARMQDPALGPAQVAYCRTVTKVWCGFFVLNGLTAGLLAAYAPVKVWAFYTSFLSYVLMGALGASEYVVRKARFREYGRGLHDRLIARLFPPLRTAEERLRARGEVV
jgi:uncharacterized membrane protein